MDKTLCKSCRKKRNAWWRAKNRGAAVVYPKICHACLAKKWKARKAQSNYESHVKRYQREYRKKYRAAKRDSWVNKRSWRAK